MIDFIPAALIFMIEIVIFVLWTKSRKNKDGNEKKLCFYGFLLGQVYLLWEVLHVSQTGKPLPGTIEQKILMGRVVLGTFMGGVFTIVGLFYLSVSMFPKRN